MKRGLFTFYGVVFAISIGVCSMVAAYTPGSGIKNSPHDLSPSSTYYIVNHYNPERQTDICIFCHLPYDSSVNSGSPTWNRPSSSIIRFETYYSGPDRPNDPNRRLSADLSHGPGSLSMFCLGCHDGSVAVNRYGSLTGNVYISDPYKIGRNGVLSNHHPIGFTFATVMDNQINMFASLGGQPVDEFLREGRMECVTCHDVHNSSNTGKKLLRMSDRNSALCCSCHSKCTR